MDFVVAFDGSPLARTALARARTLAEGVDGSVLAIAVVPDRNRSYAMDRGWLAAGASWDRDAVVGHRRDAVKEVAPEATFAYRLVDQYATRGKIGRALRAATTAQEGDVLVVGSENAGRIVSVVSSVTQSVAWGTYDLYLVRRVDERFS